MCGSRVRGKDEAPGSIPFPSSTLDPFQSHARTTFQPISMSASYLIFGRKVPAYQLSMATFGVLAGTLVWATSGPKKAAKPAIAAESSDEEKFILDYLKKVEKE